MKITDKSRLEWLLDFDSNFFMKEYEPGWIRVMEHIRPKSKKAIDSAMR